MSYEALKYAVDSQKVRHGDHYLFHIYRVFDNRNSLKMR